MSIRKYSLFLFILGMSGIAAAQNAIPKSPRDSARLQTIADYVKDPDFLNGVASRLLSAVKDTSVADFIHNLNLDFKTFQAANQPAGLGFSYKYQNSWTFTGAKHDFSQALNIDLNGNVAFRKLYNPTDFLESKLVYNASFFWGGISRRNNAAEAKAYFKAVNDLSDANAAGDQVKRRDALQRMDALHQITGQFFISLNAAPTYESNQDFSRQQFAPEAYAVLGLNAYDRNSATRWWNLPDYPFALLRCLTGPEHLFSPSGAAFPTFMAGLDYVVPTDDSLRKALTGELNPFSRIHLEASFKTRAATIDKQVIYFSADYRYYRELHASAAIRAAGIARSSYFVAALQSSNGFFISYSTGALPFDRRSDQVYALGFKYNLGNAGNNTAAAAKE